jgi:hypothetical protein
MDISYEEYWELVRRAEMAEAESAKARAATEEVYARVLRLVDTCAARVLALEVNVALLENSLAAAIDKSRAMKYITSTN